MPKAIVQALMEHLIDYAGLFPPAELAMADTVANYAAYLAGDDEWMLNRLIVPISRLDEFEQHAAKLLPSDDDAEPWRISGLTAPAGDDAFDAHLARIESFNQRHRDPSHGLAVIDVIELRASQTAAVESVLDVLPDELFPFFELPVDEDPRGLITTLVGSDAGAKVRTGGVKPEFYPSVEHLARFIHACAGGGVPFKATAGLHHPLCHHNPAVPADEFGFINVFIAAALANLERIDRALMHELLTDSAIDSFEITDDSISWRDLTLTATELEDVRLMFAVSFGSCSFDEPRDDLRSLGLL